VAAAASQVADLRNGGSAGIPCPSEPAPERVEGEISGDRTMTVKCDCGYFGPLDDCSHNRCPNCGYRVERDRTEEEIRIRAAKRMAAKRAIERGRYER